MARALGILPSALIAARGGMSANAFLNQLRSLGMGVRRAEGLQVFSAAKSIVARSGDEAFRAQNQVPQGAELGTWPTRGATGIKQTVTLLYRDKVTGGLNRTFWSTVSDRGITRERATAMAVDAYSEHNEEYEQELIGAIHTSAYNLVPGLV